MQNVQKVLDFLCNEKKLEGKHLHIMGKAKWCAMLRNNVGVRYGPGSKVYTNLKGFDAKQSQLKNDLIIRGYFRGCTEVIKFTVPCPLIAIIHDYYSSF